jgi:hypothetical protein
MRLKTSHVLLMTGLLTSAWIAPLLASDRLRIKNIAGSDKAVVVIDSRVSAGPNGCRNGEVLRTTGELVIRNVLAASGCNSEIAVFAARNAMALSTPTWTDSDGDIQTITMQPLIDVPVSIWIVNVGAVARAPQDIANANLIYGKNKAGVKFVPTVHDVSGNPTAAATIGSSCNAIGAIRRTASLDGNLLPLYTPKTLNIYYVDEVKPPPELGLPSGSTLRGLTCDHFGDGHLKGDANILFIASSANRTTLAHEIGHAFGLRPGNQGGHPEDAAGKLLPGFDERNLMWSGGGDERNHLTLGQVFRMNTQADEWGGTMLIANGLRPGPGRACPPMTESKICPPLALDWKRP